MKRKSNAKEAFKDIEAILVDEENKDLLVRWGHHPLKQVTKDFYLYERTDTVLKILWIANEHCLLVHKDRK